MIPLRFAASVLVLQLVGCGGREGHAQMPAPAPNVAPSAAPAPASSSPPTPAAACGGFETLPVAARTSLLGERLFMTPLEGLAGSARPHDVMSAAPSAQHESRLFLQRGEHKLVVFSEELFVRSTPSLVSDVQRALRNLRQVPGEERRLKSGLRAAVFVRQELQPSGDAVPVAHAVTVLPDDTLQVTHVFVSPSVASSGGSGCRDLALKLLESIEPGPRRLDLAGGLRELDSGYTLHVPPSFSLTAQRGPDFTVFQLMPILPLGQPAGRLGLYFGHHPDFEPNPSAEKLSATILGRKVTWHRTTEGAEVGQEALLQEARGLAIHLFLAAPSASAADELAALAAGLKRR